MTASRSHGRAVLASLVGVRRTAIASQSLELQATSSTTSKPDWVEDDNIQGMGVARRVTEGASSDELALKVYVERKLPESQIANPVPRELPVPGTDEVIRTDVTEIGRLELESLRQRKRPLMPGFGVGIPGGSAGSIGCLVRRIGDDDSVFLLTASHVIARDGTAARGTTVLQPATEDGGANPDDAVGALEEWVPFDFTPHSAANLTDAAIARVTVPYTKHIYDLGVPTGSSSYIRERMTVWKSGRTSERTVGEVRDIDFTGAFRYRRPGGGTGLAGLRRLVLCTNFTMPGDSGAAILNSRRRVLGLHLAGSSSVSVFTRIAPALENLRLQLLT